MSLRRSVGVQDGHPSRVPSSVSLLRANPPVWQQGWIATVRLAAVGGSRGPAAPIVIALVILGLIVTPWLLLVAIGALVVAVAVKALSLRREELYTLASRVFALEGVSPDHELVALLHELGFLLMTARGRLRMAGNYLSDLNPKTIARALKRERAAAATAEASAKIDSLARQVEALVALRNRRTALLDHVRRFAPRVNELRDALFEVRLGTGSRQDLLGQLRSECIDLEVVLNGLRAQLTTATRCETGGLPGRPFSARLRRRLRSHGAFLTGGGW